MTIEQALAKQANEPFVWGASDCYLAACEIFRDLTCRDLVTRWRGRYNTALGAWRHMVRFGGLVEVVDDAARAAGCERVEQPACGDLCVVRLNHRHQCGVVVSGGVAVKAEVGMTVKKLPLIAAWRAA